HRLTLSLHDALPIWNINGSAQYVAICSTGVTMTQYNNTGVTSSASVLAPFQAFWVKTDVDQTLSLGTSNRTTSTTGLGTFMKKRSEEHTSELQSREK